MSSGKYTPKAFVGRVDESGNVRDEWRNEKDSPYFMDNPATNVRNVHKNVANIRNEFKKYFLGKGQEGWQYQHVYSS